MAEHQEQSLCSFELEAVIQRMSACCGEKTVCTFCIDGSGSVTPGDFRVMTNFVATAMETLMQKHHACKVQPSPIPCDRVRIVVRLADEGRLIPCGMSLKCSVRCAQLQQEEGEGV